MITTHFVIKYGTNSQNNGIFLLTISPPIRHNYLGKSDWLPPDLCARYISTDRISVLKINPSGHITQYWRHCNVKILQRCFDVMMTLLLRPVRTGMCPFVENTHTSLSWQELLKTVMLRAFDGFSVGRWKVIHNLQCIQWLWGHHKRFRASVYNVRSSAHCRRKLFWCRRWTISPLLVRRHRAVAWQPPERYDKLPLKLSHGWVITSTRLMSMQLRNPAQIRILAQIIFVSTRGLWGRSPAEQLQNVLEKVLTKMLLRCLATTPVSWFRTRMLPVC